MNDSQYEQLETLIEEIRAMREAQHEIKELLTDMKQSLATIEKETGESAFDLRNLISGAAGQIVDAIDRK